VLLVLVDRNERTATGGRRQRIRLSLRIRLAEIELLLVPLSTVPKHVPDCSPTTLVSEVLLLLVSRNERAAARNRGRGIRLALLVRLREIELLLFPLAAVPKGVPDFAEIGQIGEVLLVLVDRNERTTAGHHDGGTRIPIEVQRLDVPLVAIPERVPKFAEVVRIGEVLLVLISGNGEPAIDDDTGTGSLAAHVDLLQSPRAAVPKRIPNPSRVIRVDEMLLASIY